MPMPESLTAKRAPPPGRADTCSRTSPRSVNLSAFDSRFFRICSTRCRSVNRLAGASVAMSSTNDSFLSLASGVNVMRRLSARLLVGTTSGCTSSLPASTLAMSRMSLMSTSKSLPDE